MSSGYYKTVFGEDPDPNVFLVKLNGADAGSLADQLRGSEGFKSLRRSDEDKNIVESSSSMINTVVLLFIFIAGVLAGAVLLNLTNMYILQKKRELTVMRVNGFTVKEVIGYVLRETVVTTIIGILLGTAAGAGLAYRIIRTLEQTFIQFYRGADPAAMAIAAGITVLFTVTVNVIALRKVRDLKLTDAA